MKTIGYVRVSTQKQADFGVSLESQAKKDWGLFERIVAELISEAENLPEDRQKQLRRELEAEASSGKAEE
jgi:DNA invertase Pin-like site-specific DNA recombinase